MFKHNDGSPPWTATKEATIFRQLVRYHVVCHLREQHHGTEVPSCLLVNDGGLDEHLRINDFPAVCYSELERTFEHQVVRFCKDRNTFLHESVEELIDETHGVCAPVVKGVLHYVLDAPEVSYGQLIATANFLGVVAVACGKFGQQAEIGPLIDYATYLFDQNVTSEFRKHGGWAMFAVAFHDYAEEEGETPATRSVSAIMVAVPAIVFVAATVACTLL